MRVGHESCVCVCSSVRRVLLVCSGSSSDEGGLLGVCRRKAVCNPACVKDQIHTSIFLRDPVGKEVPYSVLV